MIRTLRILGNIEGVSLLLLLLGVAMPLKYAFGLPLAVKIVGMAHGVLFLAYCASFPVSENSSGKWASAFTSSSPPSFLRHLRHRPKVEGFGVLNLSDA